MSTVGTNPLSETAAIRPVIRQDLQSAVVKSLATPPAAPAAPAVSPLPPPPPVVVSTPVAAGPVPIDTDRITAIKKAIASNSYPLIPARIGDAMIAAGMLLGIGR